MILDTIARTIGMVPCECSSRAQISPENDKWWNSCLLWVMLQNAFAYLRICLSEMPSHPWTGPLSTTSAVVHWALPLATSTLVEASSCIQRMPVINALINVARGHRPFLTWHTSCFARHKHPSGFWISRTPSRNDEQKLLLLSISYNAQQYDYCHAYGKARSNVESDLQNHKLITIFHGLRISMQANLKGSRTPSVW